MKQPAVNISLYKEAERLFSAHFGRPPEAAAYAPGRVEVLGNHTDYNEGFVLSAAIDLGTFFLVAPASDSTCRILAAAIGKEVLFDAGSPVAVKEQRWANYVIGVFAEFRKRAPRLQNGFHGLLLGNIPLGAGLSSSAALEMAAGLSLAALYGIDVEPMELARIGQTAEHEYAGVRCGLLDQISCLHGRAGHLILTDFRSLAIRTVPLGEGVRFLLCDTGVKHALVESEYNERRASCEEAAGLLATRLPYPVSSLRDVPWKEWTRLSNALPPVVAKRAAHVFGENRRVQEGTRHLAAGHVKEFGALLFESHESSVNNFENSCPELDFVVETARGVPGVLGARLSGGGFGGSVILLTAAGSVDLVQEALRDASVRHFGHVFAARPIIPSAGAQLLLENG